MLDTPNTHPSTYSPIGPCGQHQQIKEVPGSPNPLSLSTITSHSGRNFDDPSDSFPKTLSSPQDDTRIADSLEEEFLRETGAIELVNGCGEGAVLVRDYLNIDQDIARFEKRLISVIEEIVEYPRRVPYPEFKQLPRAGRAMSTAFYTVFNTSSPSAIAALLLGKIPTCVQKVLGSAQPTFEDLVALPEPTAEQRTSWIVYFDGTIRWEMEDDPKDPLKRLKTDGAIPQGALCSPESWPIGTMETKRRGHDRVNKSSEVD